jgi:hypothetical protein
MTDEPTTWIDHFTLRARGDELELTHGRMAPGTEMRVLNILREARYDNIMLVVGDGPFNVTEADLEAIANALDVSGALWRARPAQGQPSVFEDETPVFVTFATDKGALAALRDNPLVLSPDEPGSYFANAVRRGVKHLGEATVRVHVGDHTEHHG